MVMDMVTVDSEVEQRENVSQNTMVSELSTTLQLQTLSGGWEFGFCTFLTK